MKTSSSGWLLFSWMVTLLLVGEAVAQEAQQPTIKDRIDFDPFIRPIFSTHCYQCHGPKKQEGSLRLDLKSTAVQGGDSGAILVPGKSEQSHLIERVTGDDEHTRMPLDGSSLSPQQIRYLRTWIDQGAHRPDAWNGR